ncbi:RagB/SusD family nutrient uptake outer membrane protein [Mucilaginibacter sp. BT774]|uniref:RagB/SusD family nutrient uptake outer membrane protein n=1 Tax=Mucilaginibacter sp. BT774 TaxID=3062276 RepID=UPI002674ACB7|nr:RagB/SusD family nutrient uptake outer membrane protein [Mucilaginibacter sp. BT774]MDO3627587.1 RagB/SusD family nutrient uptake outer membrane protein [Mucilaginibacter sp. BT774]
MKYSSIVIIFILSTCSACKKMAGIDPPPNQLTPDKVFTDSSSVVAATANMYTSLGSADANFLRNAGSYTDELVTTNVTAVATEFSNGSLTVANTSVLSIWQNLYATIYKANAIIEGLKTSRGISSSLKDQCLGEAKFVRAYCLYQLVNIYGDVPLVTTTDVTVNTRIARSPANSVMAQVIADLNDGTQLMADSYPFSGEKVEANKWAAAALLAKAYLYAKDYANAELQASSVINSGSYTLLDDLNSVFTANNNEAILQLWNATGSTSLCLVPASGVPAYQVSPHLLAAFEPNDLRETAWVNSIVVSGTTFYYPYKYKQRSPVAGPLAEYSTYLRLAETYLVRAEARAQQGDLTGAAADLNTIRIRAGLSDANAATQTELLSAIMHERQVELFYEGGNRFFDLKRTGTINAVMQPLKPFWKPTAQLFPIPQAEVLSDPNLVQNPGY